MPQNNNNKPKNSIYSLKSRFTTKRRRGLLRQHEKMCHK